MQAGKALGLGSGAAVTAVVGARGGFAVIGTGLIAVAAIYARHLYKARAKGPPFSATVSAARNDG